MTLARFYLGRLLAYALLTGFALFMLFPFIYMASTSLKNSNDVFRVPPQLFPLTPVQREIDGIRKDIYNFTIEGTPREMVLTGENRNFGFFTTADRVDTANARNSNVVAQVPIDEAVQTDEVVTLQRPDGRNVNFDVYEVTLNGKTENLLLAYRGSLAEFVAVDDESIKLYAVARTAPKQEIIEFQFGNYNAVLNLQLDRALINTTLVTILVVAGQLVTSILGGYAFSRVEFRGRDMLFLVYLGSIMIPFVVLIIPMYRLMVLLEWQNRIVSLIVPWVFTAYGTFLMRQFFIAIPKEIEEAALLDGCSRFRILWGIFVPLSTPAIATLAIFSFLYAWNSFLWPLLIIGEGNVNNHVLTLSLIRLSNSFADQPNMVLTGAAIAILPPVIVFVLAQKYFIEGVTSSGLKG